MPDSPRDDFERRLLALVRQQLDFMDQDNPDGWEISEFVVTARYHTAPAPDAERSPWEGGPYPGWGLNAFTAGSSPQYWHDAELLHEALNHALRKQEESHEAYKAASEEDDEADA
jgi:hypothetical protein